MYLFQFDNKWEDLALLYHLCLCLLSCIILRFIQGCLEIVRIVWKGYTCSSNYTYRYYACATMINSTVSYIGIICVSVTSYIRIYTQLLTVFSDTSLILILLAKLMFIVFQYEFRTNAEGLKDCDTHVQKGENPCMTRPGEPAAIQIAQCQIV